MAKRAVLYRADTPVIFTQGTLRTHLFVTLLPLLVVCAFAVGYIQFRLHQTTHQAPIAHQQAQTGQNSSSNLPLTELTLQPELQTVSMPSTSTHIPTSKPSPSTKKTNGLQITNTSGDVQHSADTRGWSQFQIDN